MNKSKITFLNSGFEEPTTVLPRGESRSAAAITTVVEKLKLKPGRFYLLGEYESTPKNRGAARSYALRMEKKYGSNLSWELGLRNGKIALYVKWTEPPVDQTSIDEMKGRPLPDVSRRYGYGSRVIAALEHAERARGTTKSSPSTSTSENRS